MESLSYTAAYDTRTEVNRGEEAKYIWTTGSLLLAPNSETNHNKAESIAQISE